ncbi:C40 family peptidase [Paenalcaligenes sp. Me52]|uniref:C40 family peptidase n=1 Tax=Paenalcaligenes sp. Me52 TaxID=3392038 RepID=UPI0026A6656B
MSTKNNRTFQIRSLLPNRVLGAAAVGAMVLLSGCATKQSPPGDQASLDELFVSLSATDNQRYRTQSDPLGAYLKNRAQSDIYLAERQEQPSTSDFAEAALDFLGTKYRYGGSVPETGFDCSGLVGYAAEKSLGLKLPRQSADIAKEGESVRRNELQKGDLVFFNTRGARFSHVGIYIGNNKFVHAPRTGAVVRVEDMSVSYWTKRYNGARRLTASN